MANGKVTIIADINTADLQTKLKKLQSDIDNALRSGAGRKFSDEIEHARKSLVSMSDATSAYSKQLSDVESRYNKLIGREKELVAQRNKLRAQLMGQDVAKKPFPGREGEDYTTGTEGVAKLTDSKEIAKARAELIDINKDISSTRSLIEEAEHSVEYINNAQANLNNNASAYLDIWTKGIAEIKTASKEVENFAEQTEKAEEKRIIRVNAAPKEFTRPELGKEAFKASGELADSDLSIKELEDAKEALKTEEDLAQLIEENNQKIAELDAEALKLASDVGGTSTTEIYDKIAAIEEENTKLRALLDLYMQANDLAASAASSSDTDKILQDLEEMEQYASELINDINSGAEDIDITKIVDTQQVDDMGQHFREIITQIVQSSEGIDLNSKLLSLLATLEKLSQKSAEAETALKGMGDVQIPTEEYTSLERTIDSLQKKLITLEDRKEKMEALGRTNTSGYQSLVYEYEQVQRALEDARAEMTTLVETGKDATVIPKESTAEYQKQLSIYEDLNNKMRIYIEKWNEAIAKMKEANATPTPTPGSTGGGNGENPVDNAVLLKDEYTAANRALMSLTTSTRSLSLLIPGLNTRAVRGVTMLTRATLRLSSMTKGQLTTAIQGVGKALSTILKSLMAHPIVLAIAAVIAALMALKKLVDKTKKEVEAMGKAFVQGLGKAGKSIGKLTLEMGKGFLLLGTGVMKGVLNGITAVFNKIKSLKGVITENIKLMAQWRGGNNALNASMSNLTSSLAYLKAAFTSAFVPVITVIEPALTRLMNKLAEVMTMIGMFIAKLSGASTFQKAIRVQKDYAKALNGTGSAAKKTLASFDELNILNGDNGGGAAAAVDWDEVEMAKVEIPDLIAKMRELGTEVGTKIRDVLNGIPWDAVKDGADYATSAISAFINALFDVNGLGKAVGNALAELGNTFVQFVNGLLTKINFGRIGEQLGQGFQKFLDTFDFDKLGQVFSNSLNALSTLLFNFFSNVDGADLGKGLTAWFQNAFGRIDWATIRGTIAAGMEDVTGFLNEILTSENFSTLAASISEAFNSLFFGIKEFAEGANWEQWGQSIATGINNLFKSFNPKQAGQALNNLAHGLLDMILTAIKNINWDEVSNAIVEFISNIDWEGLGEKAKEISTQLMDALKKIWAALADSEAFDQIIDLIAEFLAEKKNWEKAFKKIRNEVIREVVFAKIREFFTGLGEKIMELFTQEMTGGTDDEQAHGMGYNIGKNILEGILSGIAGTPASTAFSVLFDNIWNGICQIFGIHSPAKSMEPVGENVVNGILEGFNLVDVASALTEWWDKNIAPWFTLEKWKGIGETVRVALTTKMDEIKTNLTTQWDNLTASFTEKLEILKEIFSLKFEAIKNKVVDAFSAIKDGIKTPINGIIDLVEGMINLVINGINGLVEKINTVSFDLTNPITGKDYTFGVDIPKLANVSIPRLAQGAVLPPNAPFLAMLGDQRNGTNVEAPLDTIKQALAETLQGLQLTNNNDSQTINVYLGTDLIYSEIRKLEKRNSIIGG